MPGTDTFQNACIFLERDYNEKLYFQLWPNKITDAKTVNWADIHIVGRSEPLKIYTSSTARIFNFELMFVASVDQGDDGIPEDVKSKVEFCQALAYPEVLPNSGIVTFPPVVILVVGDLIRARCVVRSAVANYEGAWFLAERTRQAAGFGLPALEVPEGAPFPSLPLYATVALQLEESNIIPHDYKFVRDGRVLK